MSVRVVARKEFTDAVRSRTLRALTALLVALTAVVFWAIGQSSDEPSVAVGAELLALPLQVIVPIAALIAGSLAVVGERQSGSLRLLLGMPPSRAETVAGKLLGRVGVVAVAVAAAFLASVPLSVVVLGDVPIRDLAMLGGATLLLAGAFVGLAVGISTAASTRGRATAAAVGSYVGFTLLWEPLLAAVHYLRTGGLPSAPVEPWFVLLERLNPIEAYAVVADAVTEAGVAPLRFEFGLRAIPPGAPLDEQVVGSVPFSLSDGIAAAILIGWATLPVALGYLRFRAADLG